MKMMSDTVQILKEMVDITMCKSECPFAKGCYRSEKSGTIPNDYRQSWGYLYTQGGGSKKEPCDYFIEVKKGSKK